MGATLGRAGKTKEAIKGRATCGSSLVAVLGLVVLLSSEEQLWRHEKAG